jgi:hypothetical protein
MLAAHCDVVLTHLLLTGVANDLAAEGTSGSAGSISKPGHCELVIGQVVAYAGNGGKLHNEYFFSLSCWLHEGWVL